MTDASQRSSQPCDLPQLRMATSGGLPRLEVQSDLCRAEVYLQGAHITQFQPVGQEPILWMSRHSNFEPGKPIRGGVPICFPWFANKTGDSQAPSHGLARTREWELIETAHDTAAGTRLTFSQMIDEWQLSFSITLGSSLAMQLEVQLSADSTAPQSYEAALHTYLDVGDVRQVSIHGLESAAFIDKVDSGRTKPASGEAIQFDGECDRVYLDTLATCVLDDPQMNRKLLVSKQGSQNTVVWNPWAAKASRLADFGNDEWVGMVCIETANVGAAAIELQPGETHVMQADVSSQR